jgi:hypothetical protein
LYGVLPYLLAERVAFLGSIGPAFKTSVAFAGILEIDGPRHVKFVSVMLVDGELEVVTGQRPSLESRDDGGGAFCVETATRSGGGVTLPYHV